MKKGVIVVGITSPDRPAKHVQPVGTLAPVEFTGQVIAEQRKVVGKAWPLPEHAGVELDVRTNPGWHTGATAADASTLAGHDPLDTVTDDEAVLLELRTAAGMHEELGAISSPWALHALWALRRVKMDVNEEFSCTAELCDWANALLRLAIVVELAARDACACARAVWTWPSDAARLPSNAAMDASAKSARVRSAATLAAMLPSADVALSCSAATLAAMLDSALMPRICSVDTLALIPASAPSARVCSAATLAAMELSAFWARSCSEAILAPTLASAASARARSTTKAVEMLASAVEARCCSPAVPAATDDTAARVELMSRKALLIWGWVSPMMVSCAVARSV